MQQLATAADLAATFNVSVKTIYAWAQEGRLPAVRLGPRCVRFRPQDAEALIADRLSGAKP